MSGFPDVFDGLLPKFSRWCPLRLIIPPTPTLSFTRGGVIMHLGYVFDHLPGWLTIKHPGVVWSHGLRPQSGHAGWSIAELNVCAVRHVGVVRRWGSLFLPADEADQSTTQQEQHGGGPADVDWWAHFSLQGCNHQRVVVGEDGCCCWPADWNQAQDAS